MSHRKKKASRGCALKKRFITALCVVMGVLIVVFASYTAGWYANRSRIERNANRYRAMYVPPEDTAVPATPTPEPAPAEEPAPASEPAGTAEPAPTPVVVPEAVDVPYATANADTVRVALPTAPPVQDSFAELLGHNPDTVGFLDIPDLLSLPVVQRENDNAFYLDHDFDGGEAKEGALFMDGVNRLVPEDDCLIVYGHNMKNGTMFGSLAEYESLQFVKAHPFVRFDTLYENRCYVPFAAFTASMKPGDKHYFDVRRFLFDATEFELFTLKLQTRSRFRMPVEVEYGDRLLLLVTCDYTNAEGRFILALRQLRINETKASVRAAFEAMD